MFDKAHAGDDVPGDSFQILAEHRKKAFLLLQMKVLGI